MKLKRLKHKTKQPKKKLTAIQENSRTQGDDWTIVELSDIYVCVCVCFLMLFSKSKIEEKSPLKEFFRCLFGLSVVV
jgi:hypothetical protein